MDPRLEQAAESGSIDELCTLIDENPYILENIDALPFVTTPLHVAAASGNIPFAMEMLNLKPSFARKLNTKGYSPLHLAANMDQNEFVRRMIWLDGDLARVKGRNDITPFLLLVSRGNADLVARCLRGSPECIQDESVDFQNALHLAVIHDRFEVLQVLTRWIQRMSQRDADTIEYRVLNKFDLNYNTPLHLAASKNDRQACFSFLLQFLFKIIYKNKFYHMMRLLLQCRSVQRNEVNGENLTFLDILRNQGRRDAGGDLREDLDLEQIVAKTWVNTSEETREAFLIVCTLIITATYQTALQPPGGVHQFGDSNAGSVVMKQTFFILIWLFNALGFGCAILYTFCLIPLGSLFVLWFFWIGTSLCISYALAMAVISPHPLVFLSATFAFFLLIALYFLLEIFIRQYRNVSPMPRLSWFWKA
ncbi:hypothetical protein BRARA_F00973 [Brassica rapa]|uniref:PGG domain-containing protein n=1 Tax=Brassica campestris TaxID=3711 RepID=A0A397Z2S3_BRACM|nr:hypothetical protein BRARA_F00973 [Brassica rapa]